MNYLKYLKTQLPATIYTYILGIYRQHQISNLQTLLNLRGENLSVDGVFGYNTMMAILNHKDQLDTIINDVVKVSMPLRPEIKTITVLENFLYHNEGDTIHYLKGEKGFTTPYGVYSVANPTSKPVLYCKTLYKKYGLSYRLRRNAYILDTLITNKERIILKELAIKFYTPNYLGKMLDAFKDNPKSLITYFSNSVNTGKARANKFLQHILGVKEDGKIGKQTLRKLERYKVSHSDTDISNDMLDAVADFYCTLITSRPKRYGRFKRGWLRRIRSIGYRGRRICRM